MTTNSGTLQNTYNYLVPAAGTTRGYRVTKEFVPGQIEVCDFRNMALDGVSFVPSGVLIDNTRGVDNCVVTILEYSWRIVIPAGQFAHMPYPAPYNQTATIEGNAPELTVVFVDYPVIPFFQNSNSGGGSVGGITDIDAGNGISIDKSNPSVPVISATGGSGGGGSDRLILLKTITTPTNGAYLFDNVDTVYDPLNIFDDDTGAFSVPAGTTMAKMTFGCTLVNSGGSGVKAFITFDIINQVFVGLTGAGSDMASGFYTIYVSGALLDNLGSAMACTLSGLTGGEAAVILTMEIEFLKG